MILISRYLLPVLKVEVAYLGRLKLSHPHFPINILSNSMHSQYITTIHYYNSNSFNRSISYRLPNEFPKQDFETLLRVKYRFPGDQLDFLLRLPVPHSLDRKSTGTRLT
ncbi:hypothetical protein AVEN_217497-1 [Araneus ventricosus]|uniref:Uncharacterized protein n=1 Tax=Araneus ventricosus TaxID=182803 RepID=A0A4Y2KC97_ARAVE|nr:hypothetical protein AVEN_217497-1 [Araneus ventricosus]